MRIDDAQVGQDGQKVGQDVFRIHTSSMTLFVKHIVILVKIKHRRPLIHNYVPVFLYNGIIGSVLV